MTPQHFKPGQRPITDGKQSGWRLAWLCWSSGKPPKGVMPRSFSRRWGRAGSGKGGSIQTGTHSPGMCATPVEECDPGGPGCPAPCWSLRKPGLRTFSPGNSSPYAPRWPVASMCRRWKGRFENQRQDADAARGRSPVSTVRCTHGSGHHRRACLRGSMPVRRHAPGRSRRTPPRRRILSQPIAAGPQRSSSRRRGSTGQRASAPTLARRGVDVAARRRGILAERATPLRLLALPGSTSVAGRLAGTGRASIVRGEARAAR